MFSVFIVFVIEISYCDSTGFQMTYRHNTVSGGVHYMRAGETLAFHLRTKCRAWGSIPLDYSWFSMWRPSLSVMTWLSCLNHLKNRTVCLSLWMKFKSHIWIFGSKIRFFFFFFFCHCSSRSFMELNYSPCTVWLHNLITCSGVQNIPFKPCQWKFLGKGDTLGHLKV